jgi:hypothetical protein
VCDSNGPEAYARVAAGRMALLYAAFRTGDGTIKHETRGATDAGALLVGLIWSRSLGSGQRESYLPLRISITIRPTTGFATCAAFVSAAT